MKKNKETNIARKERIAMGVALLAQAAKFLGWGIMLQSKSKYTRYIVVGEKKELERIDKLLSKNKNG